PGRGAGLLEVGSGPAGRGARVARVPRPGPRLRRPADPDRQHRSRDRAVPGRDVVAGAGPRRGGADPSPLPGRALRGRPRPAGGQRRLRPAGGLGDVRPGPLSFPARGLGARGEPLPPRPRGRARAGLRPRAPARGGPGRRGAPAHPRCGAGVGARAQRALELPDRGRPAPPHALRDQLRRPALEQHRPRRPVRPLPDPRPVITAPTDPVVRLAPIDYVIIALYFVAVLGVGWGLRRLTRTSTDFFLSGRSLPPWITGLAFISANLGAQEVIGM